MCGEVVSMGDKKEVIRKDATKRGGRQAFFVARESLEVEATSNYRK